MSWIQGDMDCAGAARIGIAALKAAGIGALMVTGDNARTERAIAADLGLEARAELPPQDKQAIVREMQTRGERVAKVGDGINDARRSRPPTSASPWAAARTWRWRRPTRRSCTAGFSTSPTWSACRAA